jgi:hypothetical protein
MDQLLLRYGKWELWEHGRVHCRSREVLMWCRSTYVLCACLYKGIQCVGVPSHGDDAVNRTMIREVATVILVFGNACRASSLLYCFLAYFSYCEGLGWSGFLQVHNNAIEWYILATFTRDRCVPPSISLVIVISKFVRTYETCMHHVCAFHSWHCSSPYKLIISFW